MTEMLDESTALESTTVGVYRTAATVKGGRRFSFAALVVVGDRNGHLGVGYGKANQVPPAIEKAQKDARRKMRTYPRQGRTIPHAVTGRFGACIVRLLPASPGAGVIAGAPVRAPLEMLGIQDCLTKAFGSRNPKNLVKAVINGLEQLRSKPLVAALRGVDVGMTEVEEAIKRSEALMPQRTASTGPKAVAPKGLTVEHGRGGRGQRRGGGGGGRGRGKQAKRGEESRAPRPDTAPASTQAANPPADTGSAPQEP